MAQPVLIHLDAPARAPLGRFFLVRGWCAADAPIESARVRGPGQEVGLAFEPRPDVAAAHPHYAHAAGFRGSVPRELLRDGILAVECRAGGSAASLERSLPPVPLPADKAARLARVRPHLRPGLPFVETPFHFDFLDDEARRRHLVAETDSVSDFEYPPAVAERIDRCGDELVLDCGAGNRPTTRPNVVNLEIAAYPSADVLAPAEALPFADGTFALVVSCAVLEHVRDPFAAAREMVRVVRPGGAVWADIPFLSPFHGYPSHYYNMTLEGAKNLFAGGCRIERAFVPHYGLPVWALSWFLNSYAAGLPEDLRRQFLSRRVEELTAPAATYLDEPWVRRLSAEKNVELACVTSVVAVKEGASPPRPAGSPPPPRS